MYEGYIERRASERNGMAKLTYAKAQRIRRMYASGMKQGDIAAKFSSEDHHAKGVCRARCAACELSSSSS